MSAAKKRITLEQKSFLIQYLEEHLDFAHERFRNDAGVKSLAEQWECLASSLNALGGAFKTGDDWKRAWVNMRSKTKQKAQELRAAMEKSGRNSPPSQKLTELDERIISIIGRVAIVGQESVAEPLRSIGVVQSVEMLDEIDEQFIEFEETPRPSKRQKKEKDPWMIMEEKRLAMEEKRLSIEEKRLRIEEEKLAVQRSQLQETRDVKNLLVQILNKFS